LKVSQLQEMYPWGFGIGKRKAHSSIISSGSLSKAALFTGASSIEDLSTCAMLPAVAEVQTLGPLREE
jgi:hypothetical protein